MRIKKSINEDLPQNNNFGFLRLLFAAMVVASHSPELIDGNRSRELLTRIFGTLTFGELAVDGFFLVSGYLITKSYQNSISRTDYLIKRVLRIYPGFVAASLISVFLVGPLAGGDITQISFTNTMTNLGLLKPPNLPGAFNKLQYPALNGSMWTISYEFRCYILVILIGVPFSRSSRIGYAIALTGLGLLYFSRYRLPDLFYLKAFVGNIEEFIRLSFVFFVGGAFYVWRDYIIFEKKGAVIMAAALVVLMFIPKFAEPAVIIFGGYLIFWYAFACSTNKISRATNAIDPSYGLYLYAWPIQNLFVMIVPCISPWALTLSTLPIALAFGVLSWKLVEKPALRLKNILAPLAVSETEDSTARR